MTAKEIRSLDLEQVAQVWFRSGADTVEVSLDGGITWTIPPTGTDPDDNQAQYILLAGPAVDADEVGDATVIPRGSLYGITRVVDDPQITPKRWRIDIR